ncbi:hypothetical protein SUGI_1078270 [Cryptomeria japonica]|nr:hypothetical protein SUGI_1078270 [Cryptomeria japonica]
MFKFCSVGESNEQNGAGPCRQEQVWISFQREEKCTVLETAISTKTAYIDACDDWRYSCLAKTFHEKSVAAGVPAITARRIYPGVSNCAGMRNNNGAITECNASGETKDDAGQLKLDSSFRQ